jgi:MerR family transcriptional regulator, light-induced transcriptional regulator
VSNDLPRFPPVDPAAAQRSDPTTLGPELLAGLLADGDDELAAWTLETALAEQSRAEVFDGLLNQAMTIVGERWASGQWSVAEEHLASQTLIRALERIRPEQGPEGRIGPLAVLAGVAGEHHMLGLICLDQVLREEGWTVANLGADVPAADLATFVSRNEAELVALTASTSARLDTLAEAVTATRAAGRGPSRLPVMLGGRLASHPGIAAALDLDWTGVSLVEAAGFARSLLERTASTPD